MPETSNSIVLQADSTLSEAYYLCVEPGYIRLNGSERGLFYGVRSLAMLLPAEHHGAIAVPALEISDAPRFRYRGMHLDVARHFMPVEFVKEYIELISRYKFNYFHWHLTDDQGWRIEIEKYPKLTEIGGKRRETVVGKNYRPYRGDGIPVEGFYTKAEIREIVEFARSRYVTIIPEIDFPGHTSAALAAYPEFGCVQDYDYRVKTTWGGFPDIICPSDSTIGFLKDVINEVSGLFPDSPYLHIGGDEVDPTHWRSSPVVKNILVKKNLKDTREVHGWLLGELEGHIDSYGKKMIGWDEILDIKSSPGVTVMAWQDVESVIRSVKAQRDTIVCIDEYLYFDRPQGRVEEEPLALGRPTTLRNVYEFEVVPKLLTADESQYIIGGQGCVWTEFIKKPEDVKYMAFPRAIALAEVLWSSTAARQYEEFLSRLEPELLKLDRMNVNYRVPEVFRKRPKVDY